ncbi:hypothetical protein JOF55_002938 [Haloactinomyces albus]|uniref:Uncharacterized protein n=1 Tax=Haloactinomyces albus TaxID=1352928 RepID=A0AAE4CP50_9ACTN|nr:hypothetical protein [Haloactinomyces albus]
MLRPRLRRGLSIHMSESERRETMRVRYREGEASEVERVVHRTDEQLPGCLLRTRCGIRLEAGRVERIDIGGPCCEGCQSASVWRYHGRNDEVTSDRGSPLQV